MSRVEPIYSSLEDDLALGELVEVFVDEMPSRIEGLVSRAAAEDWEALALMARQLKGAFESYGFDDLVEKALLLEKAARECQPEGQIRKALDELIGPCERVQCRAPMGFGHAQINTPVQTKPYAVLARVDYWATHG